MTWALSRQPKGHMFDSQAGHRPGLRVRSWLSANGNHLMQFMYMFLPPPPPSLPHSLSRKKIKSLFKKRKNVSHHVPSASVQVSPAPQDLGVSPSLKSGSQQRASEGSSGWESRGTLGCVSSMVPNVRSIFISYAKQAALNG